MLCLILRLAYQKPISFFDFEELKNNTGATDEIVLKTIVQNIIETIRNDNI